MTLVADNPQQIRGYQHLVVIQGLKACKIGLRLNSAYTPKNLRAHAEKWTKQKFKARDYDGMIKALLELMESETKTAEAVLSEVLADDREAADAVRVDVLQKTLDDEWAVMTGEQP